MLKFQIKLGVCLLSAESKPTYEKKMREYKATWKLFAVINHQYVGIPHTKALAEKVLMLYCILFLFHIAMFHSTLKYFKKKPV